MHWNMIGINLPTASRPQFSREIF